MLSEQEIRTLAEFESHDTPVLSLYLNLSPQRRAADATRTALNSLLAHADGAAPQDVERIRTFVEMGYNWQGQGLALFSCAAKGFWFERSFQVPVEDQSFVSFRPNIRQIADLLDKYQRYGVIHVDASGGKLFRFSLGILEDADGYLGDIPSIEREGAWSTSNYRRFKKGHIAGNMQELAEMAEEFYRIAPTRHLILAGTDKNVALFKGLLSKRLRDMVVGEIPAKANAAPLTIREKAVEIMQHAAEADQLAVADEIVQRANRNERAVVGLTPTLTAVQENRAEHVAVIGAYAQPAYRFTDSGLIVLEVTEEGELGSGRIQALPDAVESVLRRALVQGIGVTILDEHSKLNKAGKIGALLRW